MKCTAIVDATATVRIRHEKKEKGFEIFHFVHPAESTIASVATAIRVTLHAG